MKITNKYGVPKPLVNVARNDTYSRGRAQISVTQLIDSPRVVQLKRLHGDKIEADVTDMLWAIMGKAIHALVEQGAAAEDNHIAERRVFADINGWTISGGVDLQIVSHGDQGDPTKVALCDYKFTSAWSVVNEKIEWENQLNAYAWLVRKEFGYEIEALFIFAIIRDWNRHEASRRADYPQAPLWRVPVKLWTPAEQEAYMHYRMGLHQGAQFRADMGDEPMGCTPTERWERDRFYAVRREGRKRAVTIHSDRAEAEKAIAGLSGYYIEERGGKPVRCEGNYCGVAEWCSQYQAELKSANQGGNDDDGNGDRADSA